MPSAGSGPFSFKTDETLLFLSDAPPADGPGYTTDKDLPAVVEYGTKSQYDFYDPDKPAGFANPRPFIEYTREDLNSRKKELSEIVAKRIIQNLKKTKF